MFIIDGQKYAGKHKPSKEINREVEVLETGLKSEAGSVRYSSLETGEDLLLSVNLLKQSVILVRPDGLKV